MAVVKGPLFSIGASGTVAGSIVYSIWKGRPYVRQHAVPANPKSQAQLGVRAALRFLSQFWDALGAAEQASWVDPAASTNISPFNAYIQYNMIRWGLFTTPTQLYPAAELDTPGTITFDSATAGVRSITLSVTVTVLADNWGIVFFRDPLTAFTPSRNNAVRLIPAVTADTFTWLDAPLAPAIEQFYRVASFALDGTSDVLVTELSATPTA